MWLEANCYDWVPKNMWPPSSPDANPMDYFVWGYLEAHTNGHAHTTKDSLIAAIKEQFANMDKDMVKRACSRFRSRLEAIVAANGNFIE